MNNPSTWISLAALLVSLLSLSFTLYWNSPAGDVRPLEPSGYAIIRGLGVEGGIGPYPSDHLVLPMQWKNASGRPVVIQTPELSLRKIDGGEVSGEQLVFTLAGMYPDISTDSFSRRYIYNNSFLIEPHSVSVRTMVFHSEHFWDTNAYFQFTAYDEFQVRVTYTKNSGVGSILQRILLWISPHYADGKKTDVLAQSLRIHGSIDNLKRLDDARRTKADPWWDYWEDITF